MDIEKFLDYKNKKYQIKVIAPTHTYGTIYSLDSKYDFEIDYDEYDTEAEWEYIIEIDGSVIATFDNIENTKQFIASLD